MNSLAETITAKGSIKLILRQANGFEKVSKYENLIVTNGKHLLTQLMGGASTDHITTIALGSGTTPPNTSDTNLQTPSTSVAATASYPTTTSVKFTGTVDALTLGTFNELGLKSAASVLFSRVVIDQIIKGSNPYTTLQIEWTITFT